MKALVIGAARSGVAVGRLLVKHGYRVTLVSNQDFSQRAMLEALGVNVVLNDQDTDAYDDVDLVVKNPGIPASHPLVARFAHVINEIQCAAMFNPSADIYAISGTNGKTTTVSLLHACLLEKRDNAICVGNVGMPYSGIVCDEGDRTRDVALELSSFQMENLPELRVKAYALMNLSPDHLDRYDSVDAYYKVKADFASHADVCLRNCDDVNVVAYTKHIDVPFINVSLKNTQDVYLKDNKCFFRDVCLFSLSDLNLAGNHNVTNAMFAGTLAYLAGVTPKQIQTAIAGFRGVEHRLEYITTIDGVRYYNDSKATNPESTEVALSAFDDHQIYLLAGGYDKKVPFDILKPLEQKLKGLYVFGDSAQQLKHTFPQAIIVEDMKTALEASHKQAQKGDVVLLSPACASFDQFQDYEDRGRQFKSFVYALEDTDSCSD